MNALLLGVDGGGTLCRARLSEGGRILGEGLGGPANIRFGLEESFEAARSAAMQCLAVAGLGGVHLERTIACLGFAGAGEPVLLAAAQNHAHPYRDAIVTTDAHIACVGAHAGRDGGVIVAGTGTCGWAVIGAQQHRVGGWGFPISDEGSGAWLGCEIIRRVLWAEDGRIGKTGLLESVSGRFRNDPHLMVAWMTQAKPRDFASLAPLVVEHAGAGDPVGVELLSLAAAHIDALARRLLALGVPSLSLVGGLAPHLAARLAPDIAKALLPPAGDALDGALHLAALRARALGS
jgi:glucosamine kinase